MNLRSPSCTKRSRHLLRDGMSSISFGGGGGALLTKTEQAVFAAKTASPPFLFQIAQGIVFERLASLRGTAQHEYRPFCRTHEQQHSRSARVSGPLLPG